MDIEEIDPSENQNHEHSDEIRGSFNPVSEELEYELRLTVKEVLFIDDSLSLLVSKEDQLRTMPLRATMPSDTIGAPIDFIQKIGMAVLEITGKEFPRQGLVTVYVSDMELMLLREITKSNIVLGDDIVGLTLKTKVYEQLYGEEYRMEKAIEFLHQDLEKSNPELVKYLDGFIPPKIQNSEGE